MIINAVCAHQSGEGGMEPNVVRTAGSDINDMKSLLG